MARKTPVYLKDLSCSATITGKERSFPPCSNKLSGAFPRLFEKTGEFFSGLIF
jgi:hypothetical protein